MQNKTYLFLLGLVVVGVVESAVVVPSDTKTTTIKLEHGTLQAPMTIKEKTVSRPPTIQSQEAEEAVPAVAAVKTETLNAKQVLEKAASVVGTPTAPVPPEVPKVTVETPIGTVMPQASVNGWKRSDIQVRLNIRNDEEMRKLADFLLTLN